MVVVVVVVVVVLVVALPVFLVFTLTSFFTVFDVFDESVGNGHEVKLAEVVSLELGAASVDDVTDECEVFESFVVVCVLPVVVDVDDGGAGDGDPPSPLGVGEMRP